MFESFEPLDVVVICGNYNSGKSFVANKYFPQHKRINRNEIRRFLKSMTEHGEKWVVSDFSHEKESLVKHIEFTILKHYLNQDKKIVIDNTALTKKSRARYIKEVNNCGKSIGCVFIDTPIFKIQERNRKRKKDEQVQENILTNLEVKKEVPDKDEGFSILKIIKG